MAFDVAGARKAGYSDDEIADFLGKSANFDVAAAKSAGYSTADIVSHLTSAAPKAAPAKSKVDADAQKYVDSTPKAVRAFTQGVTLGAGDELDAGFAAAQTGVGNAIKRLTGKPIDYTAGDAFRAVQKAESQSDKQFAAARPITAGALNFGGALATPGMGAVGKFVAKGAPALVAGAKEVPVVGNALAGFLGAGKGAAVARAATTGALTGGAAGAAMADPGSRGAGAALGATTGAGLGAGIQKVGNALAAPVVETAQRRLSRQGVDLTPGQMAGGLGKRVEDALTSLPITGGAIQKARAGSVESFDRSAINQGLDHIGDTLPDDVKTGGEAVSYAKKAIGNAYDAVLPRLKFTPDEALATDLHDVADQVAALPEDRAKQVNKIIADKIISPLQNAGTFTGETWKKADAELGRLGATYGGSMDADQQEVGRVLQDTQAKLRDWIARVNPDQAPDINKANSAWAKFTRVRDAAASTGANSNENVFTPSQLLAATRRGDKSVGKGRTAEGNALFQDFAQDAQAVLPSKIPDSGTALRGMMGLGAYGGLTGAAGPHAALGALAADAVGSTLYSKPVLKLVNNIYRATDKKASDAALSELEGMAAKDPKVAKLYQKITAQLAQRAPGAVIEQTQRQFAPAAP